MKAILKNKTYLTVLFADIVSNFGDTVYYLALMNYVLLLKDSHLALAIIGIIEAIPMVTGIIFGHIADQIKRKLDMIILTQGIRFLAFILVGYIMSFSPALWIVVSVAFIRFLAELLGQLENNLYTPLSLRIISNEDRAEATAFSSSISAVTDLVFRFSGTLFISLLTYSHLAYLNATTFLISLCVMVMIRPTILKLLRDNPIKETSLPTSKKKESAFASFKNSIAYVFKEMMKVEEIRIGLLIVPFLNGIFASLSTLVTLLTKDGQLFLVSTAFTISLPMIAIICGQLLGNLALMTGFKNLSYRFLVKVLIFLLPVVFISLLLKNIFLLIVVLILTGLIVGIINPKFFAIIMNTMPEDKISLITSGVQTYFMSGMVVGNLILSGLLLFLSADMISSIYLCVSLGLLLYTVKKLGFKGEIYDKV